jgi:hypothetical protein
MTTTDNLPEKAPEPGALATTDDPWAELRDKFDDGSRLYREHFGLTLPRLRSDFGKNGKGWVDDLTGEAKDHLSIVILAYPPTRQYWIKSIDDGEPGPPDCRSLDMAVPLPDVPERQAETCAACPHSQWKTGEDGERIKPRCQETVNVIAFDTEVGQYVWLRFGGTALKPFGKYISALASRQNMPSFAIITEVALKEDRNGSLQWLVPQFSLGDALTPDQVVPMREMAEKAMKAFELVTEEMSTAERQAGGFEHDDEPVDAEVVGGGIQYPDDDF